MTVTAPKVGCILPDFKRINSCLPTIGRGTALGFFAGVLPGAGASLGSLLANAGKQSVDRDGKTFGKGDPRGVTAHEAGKHRAARWRAIRLL